MGAATITSQVVCSSTLDCKIVCSAFLGGFPEYLDCWQFTSSKPSWVRHLIPALKYSISGYFRHLTG